MLLYLDLATGASGDKLLSALLELAIETGAYSIRQLNDDIRHLLRGAWVGLDAYSHDGIAGSLLYVNVELVEEKPRFWHDIKKMLEDSQLKPGAKQRALATFECLAQAEGVVHDLPPARVHFHEVGAADSIIDIVGVSILLDELGVTELVSSPLALGSGTVECEHGTLPIPAPATLEVLRDTPVYAGPAESELTTPTGAALVKTNATGFGPLPAMSVRAIGYGAGSRDVPGLPNVLRAAYGERTESADAPYFAESIVLLQTNVDHLAPEALAYAAEEVLAAGAVDVWQEPIAMKKGRLAVKLCALALPVDAKKIAGRIIEETGSLGVRRTWLERTCASREVHSIATPLGECRYKVAVAHSRLIVRPEHEDVARIARDVGRPYREIADELASYGEAEFGTGA